MPKVPPKKSKKFARILPTNASASASEASEEDLLTSVLKDAEHAFSSLGFPPAKMPALSLSDEYAGEVEIAWDGKRLWAKWVQRGDRGDRHHLGASCEAIRAAPDVQRFVIANLSGVHRAVLEEQQRVREASIRDAKLCSEARKFLHSLFEKEATT